MERRKNDRVPFNQSLEIRRMDSAQADNADALDLSVSGMSFRTMLPLSIGDEVRIHLPNVAPGSSIAASVRHVAADGPRWVIGVEHRSTAELGL
jgi:hypothetical protein